MNLQEKIDRILCMVSKSIKPFALKDATSPDLDQCNTLQYNNDGDMWLVVDGVAYPVGSGGDPPPPLPIASPTVTGIARMGQGIMDLGSGLFGANLQSITNGTGNNLTTNNIVLDRNSNSSGRLLMRDFSSRPPGFSSGTMSVIYNPSGYSTQIFDPITGCLYIKNSILPTGVNANNIALGGKLMFNDASNGVGYVVINFFIEAYVNTDVRLYIDNYTYAKDINFRVMTHNTTGELYFVFGSNSSSWSGPRLQVEELVCRYPEIFNSTISAGNINDSVLTTFGNVPKIIYKDVSTSGTYMPTVATTMGTASYGEFMFKRTEKIVEVIGYITLTGLTASTPFQLDYSLPYLSNFTGVNDIITQVSINGPSSQGFTNIFTTYSSTTTGAMSLIPMSTTAVIKFHTVYKII